MPEIAAKASKLGIKTLPIFFNSKTAEDVAKDYGKANIVSSNNLVADTDDLDDFVDGVKKILDKDGIFFLKLFIFIFRLKTLFGILHIMNTIHIFSQTTKKIF